MKQTISILCVIMAVQNAFAEADFDPDRYRPTPAEVAATAQREATAKQQAAAIQQAQSNINQGSNQGQQSQSGGAGANAAAGAALMAAGAMLMSQPPTVPPGAMLMAMGILAMMQSGEDSGAAGQSANTGAASIQGNPSTVVPNPEDPTGSSGLAAKIAEGKAALAAQGYKMDAKGNLHNPDGTTTPPSAFNSPSSMAAAGMSPQAIADAQKILADANAANAAKVSSIGLNSGGGGSGGFSEGEGGGEASATGGMASNPFDLNADAKSKLMAGKTVLFDGEPIGVRGQNIFDMVHTCYQNKRKGNHFIETDQDFAVRMPSSTKPPKRNN